jgi:hypothetical protein
MPHVIALHTYGSQRVRAPSGATVSAYKIGYAVGRDVLLSLYGTSAQDVTPKHASYSYVSITGATCVHEGWLLLSLTDEELASVERYTRPSSPYDCRLWRWLDDRWQKFPNSVDASYSAHNVDTIQPKFAPQHYRVPSPSGVPETETPPIRILKPDLSANDPLLEAIRQSKGVPSPATATRPHAGKLMPIGQKYVGELTGSIAGNVFCYGYAVHEDVLLYLNLGGPRMAVEAIRARLAKGDIVNLSLWDAPAIELSAGETDGKANTGMYTAYLHSIAEAKFTSALLVHEWLTAPTYGGKSLTGIFRTRDAQATAKLLHHVRQLVNVPVFEAWAGYLYHVGQEAGLLRKPRCDGDIDLLIVDLDATAWTRLITAGLANGVIQLAREKEAHV